MRSHGVILDMDGLMLDTGPFYQRAWQAAVRELGHELSDQTFRSFSGKSDADSEAAQRGVPTGVATSSPSARADLALREAGIAEYFSVVVTCEAVARGKPAPDIFLEAARRLQLPASACIVLEGLGLRSSRRDVSRHARHRDS
jgi:beta-phosphoglucomutase-like phosphatase (HAD superfamily)